MNEILEQYERLEDIDKGSQGTAVKIRDKYSGDVCVLKIIPKVADDFVEQIDRLDLDTQIETKENLRRTAKKEVECLAKLRHRNIVEYKNFFEDASNLYIIMEYCEGGDLCTKIEERTRRDDPFTEDEVLKIFIQVARAIGYFHQRNIIHRDLKPLNIFLTKGDVVKIGDFGIATELDGMRTAASTIIGTPGYLCPEILREENYDYKSDIWSLGIVLYQLMTLGEDPFYAEKDTQRMRNVLSENFAPMPEGYQMFGENIRNLVKHMLRSNPVDRPSIDEILKMPWILEYMERMGMISSGKNFLVQKEKSMLRAASKTTVPSSSRLPYAKTFQAVNISLDSQPSLDSSTDQDGWVLVDKDARQGKHHANGSDEGQLKKTNDQRQNVDDEPKNDDDKLEKIEKADGGSQRDKAEPASRNDNQKPLEPELEPPLAMPRLEPSAPLRPVQSQPLHQFQTLNAATPYRPSNFVQKSYSPVSFFGARPQRPANVPPSITVQQVPVTQAGGPNQKTPQPDYSSQQAPQPSESNLQTPQSSSKPQLQTKSSSQNPVQNTNTSQRQQLKTPAPDYPPPKSVPSIPAATSQTSIDHSERLCVIFLDGGFDMFVWNAESTLWDCVNNDLDVTYNVDENTTVCAANDKLFLFNCEEKLTFCKESPFDSESPWKKKKGCLQPRVNPSAIALDGAIYVQGGKSVDGFGISPLFQRYNLKTDKWDTLNYSPTPTSRGSVFKLDGKIYVLGGESAKGATSSIQIYDPKTSTWDINFRGLEKPAASVLAAVVSRIVYITIRNKLYSYDLKKFKATEVATWPDDYSAGAMTSCCGKVVVCLYNKACTFDPTSRCVEVLPDIPGDGVSFCFTI